MVLVTSAGKKVLYLSIDEADVKGSLIDRATELLTKYSENFDKMDTSAPAAAAATGPKPICAGGNSL
jgi:hypothetical protein